MTDEATGLKNEIPPRRIRVEFPVRVAAEAGRPGAAPADATNAGPPEAAPADATKAGPPQAAPTDGDAGAMRLVDGVALVTLDHREALNAIDRAMMAQLVEALEELDADPGCRCIVITGAGDRAFAAGADVAEMANETAASVAAVGGFERWARVAGVGVPLVAAVKGYALGGGLELALMCDLIVAADDATFGLPEIKLGIIPGAGGTQRLPRALGRARATELILTGANLTAVEAEARGMVTRIVPRADVVPTAIALAERIASMPPLAVRAALSAIDLVAEAPLSAGLVVERRAFCALFDTEDQKEGMRAFLEKRLPAWRGR